MAKKYISADLRVINCANDIIATSGESQVSFNLEGNYEGVQRTGERRVYDEF